MIFQSLITLFEDNFSLSQLMIVVIVVIVLFNFVVRRIKTKLLKKAKSKKQISNIKIFTRLLNIFFLIVVSAIIFFSYFGSWTSLGIIAGLITAGLGFALQKPITGFAAWIMVIITRPFNIGDKICIGEVRGEVYDITLTHIYIDEIGGTQDNSLHSGRNIMVPNYLLFEQNIINYTLTNDYVMEEVNFGVTYESDLDLAMKIAKESATKFLKDHLKEGKREIIVRIKMEDSSIKVRILFYAPINDIYQISSDMTKEIYDRVKKEKDVEIAYPHTEIIFKDKKIFKK